MNKRLMANKLYKKAPGAPPAYPGPMPQKKTSILDYLMSSEAPKDPVQLAIKAEQLLLASLKSSDPKQREIGISSVSLAVRAVLNKRYPGRIDKTKNLLCDVEGVPVYLEDFEIPGKLAEVLTERANGIYGRGTGEDARSPAELLKKAKRRKVKL